MKYHELIFDNMRCLICLLDCGYFMTTDEDLPNGWTKFRFDSYLVLNYGKSQTKQNRKTGNIPIYGSSGITGYHNKALILTPCLVVGRKGSAGNISYVNEPCWPLDTTYFIDKFPTHAVKFLFWLLHYMQLNVLDTSTAIPSLRRDDVYSLQVIMPPLPEQHRIVAKIESIFAQIDACQKKLKLLATQTKSTTGRLSQLKSSVLKQAFEGKLVPQDPHDESADKLLTKINPNYINDTESKTDGLPSGWIKTKINYISELIGGGTPSRKNLQYFDGNIVWLTPTEIPKHKIAMMSNSREKITKLGLQKSSAKLIPKDAVLLTSRASIGFVAIAGTQVTTNQGFASFVCNNSTFNHYLAYWLWGNKALLEINATGTTFKEIPKSKLRNLEIPLPPLNEQHRIVTKTESIFSKIDAVEKTVSESISALDTLKQSVLKQAFEGNLLPQDPNDEPASVLLERIKNTRHQTNQRKKNGK